MCLSCQDNLPPAPTPGAEAAETKFELGQRVLFANPISRVSNGWCRDDRTDRRYWAKPPIYADGHPLAGFARTETEPREGIIVGARTLANGTVSGSEDGPVFRAEQRFTAYLIVFDLRRKPVHVLPEDIKILEEHS